MRGFWMDNSFINALSKISSLQVNGMKIEVLPFYQMAKTSLYNAEILL